MAIDHATPAGAVRADRAPRRWASVALALAVTAALVVGAWYVGGRQGFDQIGRGGRNATLLPKVGQSAPNFVAVVAADGQPVQLADYRGRPVWLNFWGSWCPPCRAEFPEMQAAYAEFLEPNGVALLAVSLDEPVEAAASYAARNGGTFTILSDPNRIGTSAYPIANFPTHVLIDRDGIVRDVILAAGDKGEIVERARRIVDPAAAS